MKQRISELTPRRQEIVRLIREGLCDKEIAARLQLETQSVRNIIRQISRETHTHSRVELLKYFYEFTERPA